MPSPTKTAKQALAEYHKASSDAKITTQVAAAALGISYGSLCNWRAAGYGPRWVEANGSERLHYTKADVEEYLLDQQSEELADEIIEAEQAEAAEQPKQIHWTQQEQDLIVEHAIAYRAQMQCTLNGLEVDGYRHLYAAQSYLPEDRQKHVINESLANKLAIQVLRAEKAAQAATEDAEFIEWTQAEQDTVVENAISYYELKHSLLIKSGVRILAMPEMRTLIAQGQFALPEARRMASLPAALDAVLSKRIAEAVYKPRFTPMATLATPTPEKPATGAATGLADAIVDTVSTTLTSIVERVALETMRRLLASPELANLLRPFRPKAALGPLSLNEVLRELHAGIGTH